MRSLLSSIRPSRIDRLVPLLTAVLGLFSCAMTGPSVNEVNFAELEDGTYRGKYESSLVSAETQAVIKQGYMTDLMILRHDCGLGRKAKAVVDRVLQNQSLIVDAVSGATYSSRAILKATENALRNGKIE